MDNRMSIDLTTPTTIQRELAIRFRTRRLTLDLTQEGLAARAGVSWSSLKRFEHKGLIALDALLRLAAVLDCLGDFDQVCRDHVRSLASTSLDQILETSKPRRKGRIK